LIWQLAGILGLDPAPLTLRQLVWMVDARRQDQWSHTAAVMALTANVHRNPKRRSQPFSPAEFHPLLDRKPAKLKKAGIRVLKHVFVDRLHPPPPESCQ